MMKNTKRVRGVRPSVTDTSHGNTLLYIPADKSKNGSPSFLFVNITIPLADIKTAEALIKESTKKLLCVVRQMKTEKNTRYSDGIC